MIESKIVYKLTCKLLFTTTCTSDDPLTGESIEVLISQVAYEIIEQARIPDQIKEQQDLFTASIDQVWKVRVRAMEDKDAE